jgi:beta-lactamase class A
MNLNDLKTIILKELDELEGRFSLAFFDLNDSSNCILINEREEHHAASTMKTPVMIEVFKQASEHKLNMDDRIKVRNQFKSIFDGSLYSLYIDHDDDEKLYDFIGKEMSIAELTYDMIIHSSNLATNTILDFVGVDNVMHTMRDKGVEDIKILRGVEDLKAHEAGLNNTTTAYDLMLVFKMIGKGEIVTKTACEAMIDILLDQQSNNIIPSKLPAEVKIAHKTGEIDGVRHDSGLIILPDGRRYILVLLSSELQDEDLAVQSMAGVSRSIYDYMMSLT